MTNSASAWRSTRQRRDVVEANGPEKTFALVFDCREEVVHACCNSPKTTNCQAPGKSDGTAHGGHLLEAYEASQHLRRTMRGEFGLALLDLAL